MTRQVFDDKLLALIGGNSLGVLAWAGFAAVGVAGRSRPRVEA